MLHHPVVTRSLLLAVLLASAAIPAARPALAIDSTWNADAAGNWSDAAKWTAGVPNAVGDIARLTYNITAPRTVTIDGGIPTVGSLCLSGTTSGYTLAGLGLNLDVPSGSALIQSSGAGVTHAITAPVCLYDSASIAVDSGELQISGTISSGVAGTGITKTGAGTLELSSINTYSGATVVSGGVLRANDGVGLPTTSNLNLSNGAILELTGGATFIRRYGGGPGKVYLSGGGFAARGGKATVDIALDEPSGITFGSPTADSEVEFRGNCLIRGEFIITVNDNPDSEGDFATMSGTISGHSNLQKAGSGTLVLTGNNTFDGSTGDGGNVAASGGTLRIGSSGAVPSTCSISTSGGGKLDIGGYNLSLRAIEVQDGSIIGTGTVSSGSVTLKWGGTISVPIVGSAGITCDGGPAVLSAVNTYSGQTVIRGQLVANEGVGIPTNSNILFDGGGILELTGGATFARTIGTGAGQVQWREGTLAFGFAARGGKVTVALGGTASPADLAVPDGVAAPHLYLGSSTADSEVEFRNNISIGTGDLEIWVGDNPASPGDFATISGSLTSTPSYGTTLVKYGAGTLVLTGANVLSDGFYVKEGTLRLGSSQALGDAGINLRLEGGILDIGAYSPAVKVMSLVGGTITGSGGALVASEDIYLYHGTLNVPLGGTANLTLEESNTTVLTYANTYSGVTTVKLGTLRLGSSVAFPSGGSVTVASNGTFDVGPYNVTAGTVTLTDGTITGATGVLAGAGYDVRKGTISAKLGGTGALTKTTADTVTLAAANTFTGPTTVSGGTLRLGASNALPGGSNVTVQGGSTLDIGPYNTNAGTVTLADGTITGTTGVLSGLGYEVRKGTVSARLGGAGALTKTTPDSVTLTAANTFTGPTTVSGGTLRLGASNALPGGINVTVQGGGTLDIGPYSTNMGTVTLADGTITGTTGILTGSAYDLRKGTISVPLTGNGALTKTTADTVTLAAANTFTVPTTVSGGALRATSGAGLPAASNLILSGGVLEGIGVTTFSRTLGTSGTNTVQWTGSGGFSASGGKMIVAIGGTGSPTALTWAIGSFVPSGSALMFGSTTADNETDFRNNINLSGAAQTVTVNENPAAAADFAALSGVLSNGGLSKDGGGMLVLSGANTYAGATTVKAGVLRATSGAGLPATSNLILSGGILEGIGATTFTRSLGASGNNTVQWTGSGGFSASGGKMTVAIGGTGSPTALTWGSGNFAPSGSALVFGSTAADNETEFRNNINLAGAARTVTVNDNPATAADFATLSGVLWNGSLVKDGIGMLMLSGANAHTGTTTMKAGALRATSGAGLPATSNLILNGGVLEGIGPTTFTRSLGTSGTNTVRWTGSGGFSASGGKTIVAIGGTASPTALTWANGNFVPSGSALMFGSTTGDSETEFRNNIYLGGVAPRTVLVSDNPSVTTDFATLSGILSSGSLIKDGPGTLALSGANTFVWGVTVTGGTLRLAAGSALASGNNLSVQGAGTLDIGTYSTNAGTVTLVDGTITGTTGVLTGSGYDVRKGTVNATLGGSVALAKTTPDTATLAGANIYTGVTTVSGGSLRATSGLGLPEASNLTLNGGVLEGIGPTTFTRCLGTSGSNTVRWTGSGGFSASGGKMIVAIGGTGSPTALTWASGNFVPSGSALMFGSTTADSETEFRNNIYLGGATRTVVVNDNPSVTTDFATLSGILSSGSLIKDGPGTLALSGANTFVWGVTVAGGTLRLATASALTSGSSLTAQGGTLDIGPYNVAAGAVTLVDGAITGTTGILTGSGYDVRKGTVNITLGGSVALAKTTPDTVTLAGANTYTGVTTVSGGSLRATSGAGLPAASNLTLNGGVLEGIGPTTFTRSLGASGTNTVQWTGGGGFSAGGGKMTVAIGGTASPTALTWGSGNFVPSGSALAFGSGTADSETEFYNSMDLASGTRTVWVSDNPFSTGDFATISGTASNGGLVKDGPGMLVLKGSHTYTGATTVAAGTLKLAAGAALASATVDVRAGATLDLSSLGSFTLDSGKILKGGGTVLGGLTVSGTVAPGESPGVLNVGSVAFGSGGKLQIELGGTTAGTQYDRLQVVGMAGLGGTLGVSLINGFRPSHNDAFTVLTCGSRTGTFPGATGLDLGSRLTLVPTYTGTAVTLTAVQGGSGTWRYDAGGIVGVPANWAGGVPNGVGDLATLGPVTTVPRTVIVDAPMTLGGLTFTSSVPYTVQGPGVVRLEAAGSADATLDVTTGSHAISAPLLVASDLDIGEVLGTLALEGALDNAGGMTITKTGAGALTISGPQTHGPGALLNVLDGAVYLNSDAGTSAANLSVFVTDAELYFGSNQHLDTLTIGDGGEVVFAGAHVVMLQHLVMDGIDFGATTLTPEPATLALLALGSLALLSRRRK